MLPVLIVAAVAAVAVGAVVFARLRRGARSVRSELHRGIDAKLAAAAEVLGGEYEPPAEARSGRPRFGCVRGRMRGCVYTLTVVENTEPPPDKEGLFSHPEYLATVRVLHFGADDTVVLRGLGLEPPDLDVNRLHRAVSDTCAAMSGR